LVLLLAVAGCGSGSEATSASTGPRAHHCPGKAYGSGSIVVDVLDPTTGRVCYTLSSTLSDVDPLGVVDGVLLTYEIPPPFEQGAIVARALSDGGERWSVGVSYDGARGQPDLRPVVVSGGILAVVLPDGRFGAVDLADGKVRWTADDKLRWSPPDHNDWLLQSSGTVVVIVGQPAELTGLDLRSGQPRWHASPALSQPMGVIVSSDGHAYLGSPLFVPGVGASPATGALDLETGRQVEVHRDDSTRTWSLFILDQFAPPSLGELTFGYDPPGSSPSALTAWRPDGSVQWSDPHGDSNPATAGDGLVVISAYPGAATVPARALDAQTGASRWSTRIPSSPAMNLMRMMVTDGYVVVGGGTGSN
jgi:outer membrane protein assembly factor BamB